MPDIHVGDTGTILRRTIKDGGSAVDISGATSMKLYVVDKNKRRVSLTGTFFTDGTDGIVDFVSDSLTWKTAGKTFEQVVIVLPGGTWHSDIKTRIVGASLDG